jgi:hypothetical protein
MDVVVGWLAHPRGKWVDDNYESLDTNIAKNILLYNISNKTTTPFIEPMQYPPEKDLDPNERLRTPSEEVFNASPNAEPYNIIEIVLIQE